MQLTLTLKMTTAQVVETSVTVNNNSSSLVRTTLTRTIIFYLLMDTGVISYVCFHFHPQSGEPGSNYEKATVAQAKRIMKPFVLRRLKSDVSTLFVKGSSNTCTSFMLTVSVPYPYLHLHFNLSLVKVNSESHGCLIGKMFFYLKS